MKNMLDLFKNKKSDALEQLQKMVEPDFIKWEYMNGVNNPLNIAPESYLLDQLLMERKGLKEIHLAIKENYSSNIGLYGDWQKMLKELQPPVLIVWGENDKVFTKEAALAEAAHAGDLVGQDFLPLLRGHEDQR